MGEISSQWQVACLPLDRKTISTFCTETICTMTRIAHSAAAENIRIPTSEFPAVITLRRTHTPPKKKDSRGMKQCQPEPLGRLHGRRDM